MRSKSSHGVFFFNLAKGYLRGLSLSWLILWILFLLFLCITIIPFFVLNIINIFYPGFYADISRYLYDQDITQFIYPLLKEWPDYLKMITFWILLLVLPIITIITNHIFEMSYKRFEERFLKRTIQFIAPLTTSTLSSTGLLTIILPNNEMSLGGSLFLAVFFFMIILIGTFFFYGFYQLTNYLNNWNLGEGKLTYSDGVKVMTLRL